MSAVAIAQDAASRHQQAATDERAALRQSMPLTAEIVDVHRKLFGGIKVMRASEGGKVIERGIDPFAGGVAVEACVGSFHVKRGR